MLDLHTNQHGYQEIYPPALVLGETLVGTGNLPKFADNLFRDAEEDKWLIPTAEVPVTNLYRDEILEEAQLPVYHVAYTPCSGREQISAGRDVRGIKRGYQFDKVEMVKFVHPDRSSEEHLAFDRGDLRHVARARPPLSDVQLCTGDLGFAAADKVDLETWAPGSQEWLEVSSCGLFMDFQARRANIRFRPAEGGRPRFVHTLNGRSSPTFDTPAICNRTDRRRTLLSQRAAVDHVAATLHGARARLSSARASGRWQ